MQDWTEVEIRQSEPRSAVQPWLPTAGPLPPRIEAVLAEITQALAQPFTGLTTDGTLVPGLFVGSAGTTDTSPIREAAQAFLASLGPAEAASAQLPMDSEHWRTWFNIHPYVLRHGVMLGNLNDQQRRLALAVVAATLSVRGFEQARNIMALNGLIGTLSASPAEFGEWLYFVSVFGTPSAEEPWGWQIDGHHLNVNCLVLGDDIVVTPTFMGSEPCSVTSGPYAGISVLGAEEQRGLDLIRSLDARQRQQTILYPSILPGTLPAHLEHWIDGRMQAGAFKDNVVLAYQGIRGDELTEAQRLILLATMGVYLDWSRPDHGTVRAAQVSKHLDETWFSWFGGTQDGQPFYYRIHSPVVLVEFDHHPGVFFDLPEPNRHHIHTIVRTPNGGDYGADLLARHYAQSSHGA